MRLWRPFHFPCLCPLDLRDGSQLPFLKDESQPNMFFFRDESQPNMLFWQTGVSRICSFDRRESAKYARKYSRWDDATPWLTPSKQPQTVRPISPNPYNQTLLKNPSRENPMILDSYLNGLDFIEILILKTRNSIKLLELFFPDFQNPLGSKCS